MAAMGGAPGRAAPTAGSAAVAAGTDAVVRAPARLWTGGALGRRVRLGSATRLAAFHALVLALVLGGVVLVMLHSFTASYRSVAASGLGAEARSYESAANARPASESLRAFTIAYLRQRALPAGDALVVSLEPTGSVGTPGSTRLLAAAPVATLVRHPPARSQLVALDLGGDPFEVLVAPVLVGTRPAGALVVGSDLAAFAAEAAHVRALALGEGLVALVVGVASTFLLLRRLLETVGRVTKTAAEIGTGRLEQRLGDDGEPDEVGQLTRTFNEMLGRIETAMGAQRRLLADVSHQLRTPLTVVRGHLEVLQRTSAGDPASTEEAVTLVLDELDHMRTLVERLLLLGRAMEPDPGAVEPIELRPFLADIEEAARALGPRTIVAGPSPAVVLEGDPGALRGAILNLVDNAVRATPTGGTVRIGAQCDFAGATVAVVVEDDGPGIPAAQREAVLRRFARPGARDADGSGLGLAIAKAVAEAHGGRLSVGESALGGAAVGLVLPLAPLLA